MSHSHNDVSARPRGVHLHNRQGGRFCVARAFFAFISARGHTMVEFTRSIKGYIRIRRTTAAMKIEPPFVVANVVDGLK